MGKSRDLADLIASGSILADGTLSTTEIDGVTATSGELNLLDGITRGSILYGADGDSSALLSIGGSGTVLTSNGTDISWTTPAPSGLQNVSEDTTPQLGGNLDLNGNDLVTTSNADINLDPNGTGTVVFKGNSTKGSGQFKLNCEVNSHGITIQGPPHSAAATYTLTLPNDDGNADQVLSTNGSGTLSWADVLPTQTGNSGYYLTTDGTNASWDNLLSAPTFTGTVTATTFSGSGASLTSLNADNISSGTLGVARGGTGSSSLTANNVILGNGTSSVQTVAPGTSGNVLTSNGSTWVSQAAAGGGGETFSLF